MSVNSLSPKSLHALAEIGRIFIELEIERMKASDANTGQSEDASPASDQQPKPPVSEIVPCR